MKGQARLTSLDEFHQRLDVAHVVSKRVDIEPFAVRLSPSSEIDCVHRDSGGGEPFADPRVVAAMRIEPGNDHDDAACLDPVPEPPRQQSLF